MRRPRFSTALWTRIAGAGGLLLGLVLVLLDPALLTAARDRAFDQFQRIAPREPSPALSVRVVEIDDAALAAHGQWPWPRHRLADMVDRLGQAGAAVVVFDVLFPEPDRTSPARAPESWVADPSLAGLSDRLKTLRSPTGDHDRRFAEALQGTPVVLNVTAPRGGADASAAPCPPAFPAARVDGMRPQDVARTAGTFRGLVAAVEPIRSAAAGEGFGRVSFTEDAVVRRVPLVAVACDGARLVPSFSVEALRVAAPRLDPAIAPPALRRAGLRGGCRTHLTGVDAAAVSQVHVCGLHLPTASDGGLWVRYTAPGEREKARRIAVDQVLTGDAADLRAAVSGKIVLIGATAEGLRDIFVGPLGDERPGVHIHAELLEQILDRETLSRTDDLLRPVELALALAFAVALLWLTPRVSALAAFGVWLFLTVNVFIAAFVGFSAFGTLLDPVGPGLILALTAAPAFVAQFQQDQSSRRFVREAFGRYISPVLLDRLEKDPSRLSVLDGETRTITALFSDIRGFTTISETLQASQVKRLLNAYLTPMSRIVMDRKGLVDKYMGDGMAAMWNAPLDVPDHAALACRAALSMQSALVELNRRWAADPDLPIPPLRIGVGLHTGEAQVGNFGSDDKIEYSMLGDTVNLASRLESLTKTYAVGVLISEAVRDAAPGFATVPLGAVTARGRAGSTRIFALVGDEALARDEAFGRCRDAVARAVDALAENRTEEALKALDGCRDAERFGLADAVAALRKSASPPGSA